MIIDSHHHFWDPDPLNYPWMTEAFSAINRSFWQDDFDLELAQCSVDGTILVQTFSSIEETANFLRLAATSPSIYGVVGWIDLTSDSVSYDLAALQAKDTAGTLVSIRHQVHDEPDDKWLERPDVTRGLQAVNDAGLAFDLLIRPRELPSSIRVVRQFPEMSFVIDHIAKPDIKNSIWSPWAEQLREIAREPNVYCKISGIVTECDWRNWSIDQIEPYVAHVLACFGANRCLFGSDWPVCLVSAEYSDTIEIVRQAMYRADSRAVDRVFSGTAIEAYKLRVTSHV